MNEHTKITRESIGWILEQPVEMMKMLLQHHSELCRVVVNSILESEVASLTGAWYTHDKPHEGRYSRYGFNPGSVRVGASKIGIDVPRVSDAETKSFKPLSSYEELKRCEGPDEQVLKGMLSGLSTRNYGGVVDILMDGFGLSSASVSKRFVEASQACVKEFEARVYTENYVALFIDGLHCAGEQLITMLGVTDGGVKHILHVMQSHSESSRAIGQELEKLIGRGFRCDDGLLIVIDGSKGIRKAVEDVFKEKAMIQRCTFHKRENVVSYLNEEQSKEFTKKYSAALALPGYKSAHQALTTLANELARVNKQAAASLREGLEELLTVHKLGLREEFGKSFLTTNMIENQQNQIRRQTKNVKNWMSPEQKLRWVISALMQSEQRMKKITNHKELHKLQSALRRLITKHEPQH